MKNKRPIPGAKRLRWRDVKKLHAFHKVERFLKARGLQLIVVMDKHDVAVDAYIISLR